MNKELYIKREEQLEELEKLSCVVYYLQTFLAENGKNFKREESIEALNKIKVYFELKEKEYHECWNKQKQIDEELYSTCSHEVAVKYFNPPHYRCLICDCDLCNYSNDIPEDSLIAIDITQDNQVAYVIADIFKEVLHSDKDLIETISDAVLEMQYDRDIKVYRRSR